MEHYEATDACIFWWKLNETDKQTEKELMITNDPFEKM